MSAVCSCTSTDTSRRSRDESRRCVSSNCDLHDCDDDDHDDDDGERVNCVQRRPRHRHRLTMTTMTRRTTSGRATSERPTVRSTRRYVERRSPPSSRVARRVMAAADTEGMPTRRRAIESSSTRSTSALEACHLKIRQFFHQFKIEIIVVVNLHFR